MGKDVANISPLHRRASLKSLTVGAKLGNRLFCSQLFSRRILTHKIELNIFCRQLITFALSDGNQVRQSLNGFAAICLCSLNSVRRAAAGNFHVKEIFQLGQIRIQRSDQTGQITVVDLKI